MRTTLGRRIRVRVKTKKIHQLKLTNSFSELSVAFLRIIFGKLIRNEKTRALEEAFRKRFKSKSAIVFPHARTALHFILKSMDLEKGREILMPPLTIADMVNSIHTLGLKTVFVDIEIDTFCIDPEQLEKAITPKSKVILVTYIFGIVPNIKKIQEIAQKHGLTIIEDCSQCFDAFYSGQPIGTFGDAAIFSLTNFKVCSSLFGGVVITNKESMAVLLNSLRNNELFPPKSSILLKHIIKNLIYTVMFSKWVFSYFTYFVVLALEKMDPKITYRLYSGNIKVLLGKFENELLSEFPPDYLSDYTDVQAQIGLCSLSRADEITSARIKNGELLRELLQDIPQIKVPVKLDRAVNVYWRFPILSNDMEGLKKYLLNCGIDSSPTYLTVCSNEPGFKPYHKSTPNSERLKKDVLLVEVNEDLSEGDIRLTASLVRSYFTKTQNKE